MKEIKSLLREKGIKVTARKDILIQRYLCPTDEDFLHPSRRIRRDQDKQRTDHHGNGEEGFNEDTDPSTWEEYCAHLTEERVLQLGLMFANYTKHQQDKVNMETNRRRFRSHYCVGAKAVMALVKDLPPQIGLGLGHKKKN